MNFVLGRNCICALTLVLTLFPAVASASDVAFELDSNLTEQPETVENYFSYDSPLYEGLWPGTIEAFRQSDIQPVFTFCIAFNR